MAGISQGLALVALGVWPRWGAHPTIVTHCPLLAVDQQIIPVVLQGKGQKSVAPASNGASDVGTNSISSPVWRILVIL